MILYLRRGTILLRDSDTWKFNKNKQAGCLSNFLQTNYHQWYTTINGPKENITVLIIRQYRYII